MADTVNLRVDQGSTYSHRFDFVEQSSQVAINLTGYSARWQIRPFVDSDDLLLDGDTDAKGMIAITNEAGGQVTIEIPGSVSSAWDQGITEAVYDVEVESPAGVPTRIVQGSITISPETTR